MSIVSTREERWAARALTRASEGRERFGTDAAQKLVREIRTLPVDERAAMWRLVDSFTETARRVVSTGVGDVAVELPPISRPDADASALLARESKRDLDAVGGLIIGERGHHVPRGPRDRVSEPFTGTSPAGDPVIARIASLNFSDDPVIEKLGQRPDLLKVRRDADGNGKIELGPRGWVAVDPAGVAPADPLAPRPVVALSGPAIVPGRPVAPSAPVVAPAPLPPYGASVTFRIVSDPDPLKRLLVSDVVRGERLASDDVLHTLRALGPLSMEGLEREFPSLAGPLLRDLIHNLLAAQKIRNDGGWVAN